jgi:pyruvate dehydrogenase E2 component (dihydrolipoamide acetyltransferase)
MVHVSLTGLHWMYVEFESLCIAMPAIANVSNPNCDCSPTMSAGALAEWYVAEGDKFVAGDGIAKIETDKASIDFEAQDDGYVAKLLMEAGSGTDVAVGTPIMITVEEQEDVNAFKGYVLPATAEIASPAESAKAGGPSAPEAVSAPKAVAPAPPVKADTPPPPTPPPAPVSVPTPSVSGSSAPSPSVPSSSPGVAWGLAATVSSPLAKTLAAQQKAYIEAYGSTGQKPI